jgi:curli production assembly/transport component CsgF
MKITICGLLLLALSHAATASELTYKPVNPNFGGNPLNGNYLLGNAQAQNNKKDPDSRRSGYTPPSDLERFASSLESRLLSQLLTDIEDGSGGSLETNDFSVNIVDDGGALSILITDKNTNGTTEIQVSGLDAGNP